MDEESAKAILERVPTFAVWRVGSYADFCVFVVIAYHYLTTIDEEVGNIWPQPRWKSGKVLFLTARYSALFAMVNNVIYGIPIYTSLNATSCSVVFTLSQASTYVFGMSIELTLWLVLYALFGGEPRYFALVILTPLTFTGLKYGLQGAFDFSQAVIPLDPLDAVLGWPCSFDIPKNLHLYRASAYLSTALTLITTVFALTVLFQRYRMQKNNFLRAIKREGGVYFALTLILKLFRALSSTPNTKIEDTYDVAWGLQYAVEYTCSQRLLLSLFRTDNARSRAVISSIAFDLSTREDDLSEFIAE